MLRPKGDFWIDRYRRQADYERGTFTAKVTAVYSDGVYDVETGSGLSGGQFYDVNNTTLFNFVVGSMVIVARVGGGRGNRHVIIAKAGAGSKALPYAPGPAPGGEYDPTESLSEVIDARDSAVYGSKSTLDARLEAGDAEVNLARQGYASLSDRIAAKADLSSPQFTGTPRAEKYEVHDGAKYITFDGGGNLTLTDGVTGSKTLSELAASGGGGATTFDGLTDTPANKTGGALKLVRVNAGETALEYVAASAGAAHNLLSATHSDADVVAAAKGAIIRGSADATPKWTWLSALAKDGRVLRVVQGMPVWVTDLGSLGEQMLERVLRCTLDSKPGTAKAYKGYYFNDTATANNGIATWSGAGWTQSVTRRQTSTSGNYYEQYFIGDGVSIGTGSVVYGSDLSSVTLDGAAHGTWNQPADLNYLITGLSYGVHVVRVTCNGAAMFIGAASFNQWPYQGCGVSGDAAMIEYWPPLLHVTTIGTGPTDNGGAYGKTTVYGEAMTPRLPLCTVAGSDTVYTRSPCGIGSWVNPGYVQLVRDVVSQRPVVVGETITLGAGGAIRGLRPTSPNRLSYGRPFSAAIIYQSFTPFMARVTATVGGSVLTVGELVLGITTRGANAAADHPVSGIWDTNWCAADFYKLPAALM